MVSLGQLDEPVGDGGGAGEVEQVLAVDHRLGQPDRHPRAQGALGVGVVPEPDQADLGPDPGDQIHGQLPQQRLGRAGHRLALIGKLPPEQVIKRRLGDRVQAAVVGLPAGADLGQQVPQGQGELFPLLPERLDDLLQPFGQPAVMLGVLIPVLAQVVADRVLHLRRPGPGRTQAGDLGVEVGGGDRHRRDLLLDAECLDMIIDQPADLLPVQRRVEPVLAVTAPRRERDHPERPRVRHIRQGLGAGQHDLHAHGEQLERRLERHPQPLIRQRLDAGVLVGRGAEPVNAPGLEQAADPLAALGQQRHLIGDARHRPLNVLGRIGGQGDLQVLRHPVVIHHVRRRSCRARSGSPGRWPAAAQLP